MLVESSVCTGPDTGPLPGHVQAEKDQAEYQNLAQNLDCDGHTHSLSRADNPEKEPFLSSWILLLFKILRRENERDER